MQKARQNSRQVLELREYAGLFKILHTFFKEKSDTSCVQIALKAFFQVKEIMGMLFKLFILLTI